MVVVSDHGMTSSSLDRIIYLQDYINVDSVKIADNNPILHIFPLDPSHTITLYQQLRQGSQHYQVYLKEHIPTEYQYRNHIRIAPIVLVADLVRSSRHCSW